MPNLNLDWRAWVYGIVAGFIGGGASAIVNGPVAAMIAPAEINLTAGFKKLVLVMLITFFINGLISMFMYLKQHPLPDIEPVIRTETTTMMGRAGDPNPMISVKVVEETHKKEDPPNEQKQ